MPDLSRRVREWYRRSGADLPGGDPRPSHGAEMEGYFWRITDASAGRVVIALCGVNQHPAGDWATVALGGHPGAIVRSDAVADARAATDRFRVTAGDGAFDADDGHLAVSVGDCAIDVRFDDRVDWPLRLGGGGIFAALPRLGQYWHPHVLGGRVTGVAVLGDERWQLDGATVYAEKNWGAGFPDRWWWGQAHDFDDDVCVAFGGGLLRAGPIAASVGGCVVRLGATVLRFTPPTALVRSRVADGVWRIDARRPGWRLVVEGDGGGCPPHVLPVPVPSERRNVPTDLEHLAGRMRVRLTRRGSMVFDGATGLAGLEVGSLDGSVSASWPTV